MQSRATVTFVQNDVLETEASKELAVICAGGAFKIRIRRHDNSREHARVVPLAQDCTIFGSAVVNDSGGVGAPFRKLTPPIVDDTGGHDYKRWPGVEAASLAPKCTHSQTHA